MNKYDAIKKSYDDFLKDWQDIIGPGGFDTYYAGYFEGEKRASADLAAAEERGRREAEARYTPSAVAYIKELESEIAALREALDAVRWNRVFEDETRAECRECDIDMPVKGPEVHAEWCKIGRLFAPKPEPKP